MIPAVILAAGASTRMGRAKATLPVAPDGETFVARLLRTFSSVGVDDLVVVVGAHAEAVVEAIRRQPVFARIASNPNHERGQLSSLVAALDVVDRPGVRGLLSMPVDMPLVAPSTVRAVLDAYRQAPHAIVRPARDRHHGHPVLFDRRLFAELRAADLSRGARVVIAAHLDETLDVTVSDEGAFRDIDTPEDYEQLTGLKVDA